MADNKNVELNDEEMQKAAGGDWNGNEIGLPFPKFKEGDHVIVKGYEHYDAVIVKVLKYYGYNGWTWNYEVHIFHPAATIQGTKDEKELSPATK